MLQLKQVALLALMFSHPGLANGMKLKKTVLADGLEVLTSKGSYLLLDGSGCTDTAGDSFDSWYSDVDLGASAGTQAQCESECDLYPECLGYETINGLCFANRFSEGTRPFVANPSGLFEKNWDGGVGVAPMSLTPLAPHGNGIACHVKLVGDAGGSGGGVQVTGDPHVTTFGQKHFDLHYRGSIKLLELTSVSTPQEVLLQVNGTTGGSSPCGAQYLKEILITGQWTKDTTHDFRAEKRFVDPTSRHHKARLAVGPGISLVVSHGITDTGIVYLNFRTSNLAVAGVHVGGLLGDEDFTWAAKVPEECL